MYKGKYQMNVSTSKVRGTSIAATSTALVLSALLGACSSPGYIKTKYISLEPSGNEKISKDVSTRIPKYDINQPLSMTEQYSPKGFSLGAWIKDKFAQPGSLFQPLPVQSSNVALVYVYRPHTRWNAQEIIAPSFFLNGVRMSSLTDNTYYWLELPAGEFRLSIRRPLGNMYFQKGTNINFKVEAGNVYYLRYDEQKLQRAPDPALGLLAKDAIMQIPAEQALTEITATRLSAAGYSFVPVDNAISARDLPASFIPGSVHKVNSARLVENNEPVFGVPFKLWNPLSW